MDGEAPAAAALRLAAVARKWLENPRDSLARSREEGCGDAFNTVAVDNLCSAVVYTADGVHRFTVNQAMSFFSPAAHGEEVEMDGRVAHRKGKLTAAVVEVRRKASGELVAIGRQWMTSTRARPEKNGRSRSKL